MSYRLEIRAGDGTLLFSRENDDWVPLAEFADGIKAVVLSGDGSYDMGKFEMRQYGPEMDDE